LDDEAPVLVGLDPGSLQIVVTGWLITVALAVVGWLYTTHKTRQLQRKQIAISLLQDSRFDPTSVKAMHDIFFIINNDTAYDWKCLATRYFGTGTLDQEQLKVMVSLKIVLNYFELVAIAVRNKAASEEIIRWSCEMYYDSLKRVLTDFFVEARTQTKDKGVWINITNLADSWAESPGGAVPTS